MATSACDRICGICRDERSSRFLFAPWGIGPLWGPCSGLRSTRSLPIRGCGRLFFPTRGKEPKGDRGQRIRDSTSAAPGPLLAWLGSKTSRCARLSSSSRGRLAGIWGVMPLVRWRPGGTVAAFAARGLVGLSRYCGVRMNLTGWKRCVSPQPWHGRRSKSSLRRPPQEVAASCP